MDSSLMVPVALPKWYCVHPSGGKLSDVQLICQKKSLDKHVKSHRLKFKINYRNILIFFGMQVIRCIVQLICKKNHITCDNTPVKIQKKTTRKILQMSLKKWAVSRIFFLHDFFKIYAVLKSPVVKSKILFHNSFLIYSSNITQCQLSKLCLLHLQTHFQIILVMLRLWVFSRRSSKMKS